MRTVATTLILLCCFVPQGARAARIGSIVRGVGAGSDKAAGFASHAMRQALTGDSRYQIVDLEVELDDRARPTLKQAEDEVARGRAAYEALDLDVAVEALTAAVRLYERDAAVVTDPEVVAKAFMLLAAAHILRGDEKVGTRWISHALAVYPKVEPDPLVFNATMRQLFQNAASALAKRPHGTISISSNPSYAEVYLDGRFVGVTPTAVERVTEGRHFLRLVKDGYKAWGHVVEVTGKAEASDVATLKATKEFEEYDGSVEAALPALANKRRGDGVGGVLQQLGVALKADLLMIAQVRLDGERVNLVTVLVDARKAKVLQTGSQAFAYGTDAAAYDEEVRDLLDRQFSESALATGKITPPKPGRVKGDLCIGMPCERFKLVASIAGGGAGVVLAGIGGLFYGLAKSNYDSYKTAVQLSPEAQNLRSNGQADAVAGDICMVLGVALVGASVGFYFLYNTSPSTKEVVESSGWGFAVAPLPEGAAFSAKLSF